MKRLSRIALLGMLMSVLVAGCAGLGPKHVERDRIEYTLSMADSWKRQILLNVVRIRYVEPLSFIDVGEIVSAYSLETGGSAGSSFNLFSGAGDTALFDLGATAKYTDRPTITYRPLTGLAFFRGIMSPMPLLHVLMSIESGVSVEFLLRLGVRSINGLRNETITSTGYRAVDSRFVQAVKLLASLQSANALHVDRAISEPGAPPCLRLRFGSNNEDLVEAAQVKDLKGLLGLDPDTNSFVLGFGATANGDKTIMLQTYSLAQVLASVSGRVDMPEGDVASHRALPGMPTSEDDGLFREGMVRSSKIKPEEAFVSVQYRGNWFWVDDFDLRTKKVFSFIMLAFTLMDKGSQDSQLQLTVPTQ
ncbi:hypothetical protein DWB63_11905 [Pseudodesulfovibrio sp. S3]|nr:hypothetical protein DWB63_11905 [Pseudodesulfovibrio sp. S3]